MPPVAAINSVPIVGGDFDQEILAKTLDHQALNQAAASLYRDRFDNTPGIVYAAGVDHAYNLAQEFRAAGLKAEAVSGRTPPVRLAETLAAYERGEINVLINAQLLAEGWNSPRATVCMHLAPTASKRVYQQRIGRIMRLHPRKEAGIVVDFVPKGATHNERVVSLHSLLDADFYREGARVTPAPRRRSQRRARRRLTPAPWLVPVTPDVRRRIAVIQREWQRVDPRFLDEDEQRYWATIAGRQIRFDERASFVQKLTDGQRVEGRARTVPRDLRGGESESPPAHDGVAGSRVDARRARRLRRPRHARDAGADVGEGAARRHPHPACARSPRASPTHPTRSSSAGRGGSPARRARCRIAARRPSIPRRSACSARSRTRAATATRRTRRSLVKTALEQPIQVGAALLASAEGYTPRATKLIDDARENLGAVQDVALALAENLPAPKQQPSKRRRRRRKKKRRRARKARPRSRRPLRRRTARREPPPSRSPAQAPQAEARRRETGRCGDEAAEPQPETS